MTQQFDVLVAGGGIVGLTSALAMAQRNYSVAVIDAGSLTVTADKQDLRVYAINKASQSLLTQLGVWQHLDGSRISPYRQMHVWDGVNGAYIDFDSRMIAAQNLGFIIEESVLKQALLEHIGNEPRIHLFAQSSVEDVVNQDSGIRISSKDCVWDGQLLMVADGANSPSRQKLDVALTSWPYEQHAIVAMVKTEKAHQSTAYQVFNPDGPLALLPLTDPHHCSIVWSTDSERSHNLMALDEEQFNTALTRAFAHQLGTIELLSTRHQFPLHMRHVKQYAGSHWLLLGDAAHTIHPLAGLGLNLGLADISSWLKCLDTSKNTLVSGKILGAYQRERKHAVWQTIMLMEGFKRLFGNSQAPVISLRGLGLRFCNDFSPIKRLFIQHAAGA
ncbi:FAD-dependent monooxygenase [Legionella shakespearei]|uniref:2-polyprenyl-6-methoxyphenol hydroxylase n=1 Tax=Legionella shakespearei DSM 23087 TaxID=1122169 RepID=A0A0W0YLN5_9GAMM|nr:FAD-dependent monooxygenase [Legionella shakespearei]KTD57751.1 2-polyprenyl-6-methoxyphenol hydroxylase [Legionella shakespearei DSM 23087]